MAKDLKVGDRVRAYGSSQTAYIQFDSGRDFTDGTVKQIGNYFIQIKTSENNYATFHPKQCRRLKPKAKKVAREVWLASFNSFTASWSCFDDSTFSSENICWMEVPKDQPGAVHFREVIK